MGAPWRSITPPTTLVPIGIFGDARKPPFIALPKHAGELGLVDARFLAQTLGDRIAPSKLLNLGDEKIEGSRIFQ